VILVTGAAGSSLSTPAGGCCATASRCSASTTSTPTNVKLKLDRLAQIETSGVHLPAARHADRATLPPAVRTVPHRPGDPPAAQAGVRYSVEHPHE